jgi:hypothetical protein
MARLPAKIVVVFERRPDGGLRAYSDDVPGFVLSHRNPKAVLADVKPALEGILSQVLGGPVVVEELTRLHEQGFERLFPPASLEYVTHRAA